MYTMALAYKAQEITHATVHTTVPCWELLDVITTSFWYQKMVKHIVVTGASAGIGLALCKLLIRDHDCYVYLGSRNVEKGKVPLWLILMNETSLFTLQR